LGSRVLRASSPGENLVYVVFGEKLFTDCSVSHVQVRQLPRALDGGHFPNQLHDVMREILDWFERDLGHVTGLKSS
jgi:hypothetical protein